MLGYWESQKNFDELAILIKATLSAIALAIETVFWLYLGSSGSENSNFLHTDNRLNFLS